MIDKVINKAKERINNYGDTDFERLRKINFSSSNQQALRVNLVLPKIEKKYVYGGISTALKFFNELAEKLNAEKRVLSIDKPFDKKIYEEYPNWEILKDSSKEIKSTKTVLGAVDPEWRKKESLPVRQKDIFITTSWETQYIIKEVTDFQLSTFNVNHNLIYLIQDFEPGFSNWSSDYMLAESTYKSKNTIAVFNSANLKNYMEKREYPFKKTYYFDPNLNVKMANILNKTPKVKRENIVLLYGRPSTSRNGFEIAVKSLKVLIENYNINKNWKFISIGEKHRDIDLGNNFKLKSLGKLSLEEYSNLLLKSKIGISLMFSPHPSYPPLEMSTFGVKTITNSFEEKNLSTFNENIISLDNLSFEELASAINTLMNSNSNYTPQTSNSYVDGNNQFNKVIKAIASGI